MRDLDMERPVRRDVILVTGATGRVGRLVVDELVRAGARARALTRRPELATLPGEVEVVAGDFTAPSSIAGALDEVTTVFLVWTAPASMFPAIADQLAAHPSSGLRRVVYLSAPHRTPHPFFQQPNPMRDLHAEIERVLATTGLEVAVVRPGMLASNAIHWWAPQLRNGDVVRWPYAEAETAPLDERDTAAVAARVLLDDRHACGDYVLTGPESLSQAAQLGAIAMAIGRPVRFEELSPDEFRRETEGTWPAGVADMLLAAWSATLGRKAFVTSNVEEIIGRPAAAFEQWATDHASAFARSRPGAHAAQRVTGTDV
jgi:uncharacterized protein YbjT (DUF2867 family)